jgi:hypothetical protein
MVKADSYAAHLTERDFSKAEIQTLYLYWLQSMLGISKQ